MSMTKSTQKPLIQGAARIKEGEQQFKLSLPALVKGINAQGKKFQEQTELLSISSEKAILWLDSHVTIGSLLDVSLDIPKTLILETPLKLLVSGKVNFIQKKNKNNKNQLISVQLNKKFQIHPPTSS